MTFGIDNYNDLYLIKEQNIERLFSKTCSTNRFVVSEAILYVFNLIESCYGANSHLLGVNTDGVFSTKQIGKVLEEDKLITYFEKNYQGNLDMNDFGLNI